MTDHLPECYLSGPPNLCPMCEALRACEQRVFQEQIKGRQHDMVMAYLRGLDAARDCDYCKVITKAREDERAKCIALIEESVPWSTDNWIAVDERAAILTALRALQEKP